ncbi:MAG: CBS domain-containing protein [Desulfosudaceae bacterium]
MPKSTDSSEKHLTVITTHVNADYDAISSVLAAQKLYPGSVVVLPGSNEKNLRNFFINSMVYLFNMKNARDIDFAAVKRLVIVDTNHTSRIGILAELLDDPGLEVHIYDHHPPEDSDIKAVVTVSEPVGATVSILTRMLREKGAAISPDEATVMCLGIYEDTGAFTFVSTTPDDFEAAGFLVSRGACLNTIANMITREMTPEQVDILNSMIKNSRVHNINGLEVVISSIATEEYVPDFAFLVHKMQRMKNLNVIFAAAQMGNRIYLVGRSRVPEVNAGDILIPFGGGGHAFAASASIKRLTLTQVEQQLMKLLNKQIRSTTRARDVMSSPPISTTADTDCRQAGDLLVRYNVNALLVTDRPDQKGRAGNLLGYISRQVIEKAIYHDLGESPIGEYMTTDFLPVGPDDELSLIQERIIENHQRIVPVVEKDLILGVITRTDLLNLLVSRNKREKERQPQQIEGAVHPKTKNIKRFMSERLPQPVIDILEKAGQAATDLGYSAYVVGGFVRDLFLYRKTEDVDLVIEGDGIAFARTFAEIMGARVHFHHKFGTAVVIFPDESKIDVASARLEYYQFPAALPTVEMSSIKLDLFRRDFTINTLAVYLNPDRFGTLVDFFSAQRDIKEKTIRVLHNLSFVEDPTRVFRAIRFEQRFGFSIGKMTSGLIENAVKMNFFSRLSRRRVFAELCQILEEEDPVPAIERLAEFELLAAVHPAITIDKKIVATLNSVKEVLAWYDLLFLETAYSRWAVYFLVLINRCDESTSQEICREFELNRRQLALFTKERLEANRFLSWLKGNQPVKNSQLYEGIRGFSTELILYIMAIAENEKIKRQISRYILQLQDARTMITGEDLSRLGIPPGPVYGRIFKKVLHARLDGLVNSKNDELELVQRYAGKF